MRELKGPTISKGDGEPDGSRFYLNIESGPEGARLSFTASELQAFFNQLDQFMLHIQLHQRAAQSGVAIVALRAENAEAEAAPENAGVYVSFLPPGRSVRTFAVSPAVARKLASQLTGAAAQVESSPRHGH